MSKKSWTAFTLLQAELTAAIVCGIAYGVDSHGTANYVNQQVLHDCNINFGDKLGNFHIGDINTGMAFGAGAVVLALVAVVLLILDRRETPRYSKQKGNQAESVTSPLVSDTNPSHSAVVY